MSKMDNLRALRESRYAQDAGPATKAAARSRPTAIVSPARPDQPFVESVEETAAGGLCGHRNMGGRTCTREHGHAAKSHRYS